MEDKIEKSKNKHGQVFFNWQFPEFQRHERKKGWYITSGLAVAFLLLYSIFAHNYIFGLFIILASLTFAMFHRSDNEVDFSITEDGIKINSKFYSYSSLQNFFIIYVPPDVKVLYFQPKNILNPRIPVYLEDQDPVKIRETLLKYLDEDLEQEDEPLSDQASRTFKL